MRDFIPRFEAALAAADVACLLIDTPGDARDEAVGEPRHGRLLVNHDGHARERGGERYGQRDEAAGGKHDPWPQPP